MPNGKVEFRDYSLNKGLPVVGMHLYNGKGNYYIKFGSHPIMEVAMERCISELFQGRTLKNVTEWMRSFSWKDINKEEFYQIFRSGDGNYPYWVFGENYTYNFENIWFKDEDKSNVNFYKYVCEIIRRNRWELYIRDTSWLGFPSYQVLVPGVSEINKVDRFYVKKLSDTRQLKILLRNLPKCNEHEYEKLYTLLHTYYPKSKQMLSKVLDLPLRKSVMYAFVPCVLLEFYLYLALNKRSRGNYGLLRT